MVGRAYGRQRGPRGRHVCCSSRSCVEHPEIITDIGLPLTSKVVSARKGTLLAELWGVPIVEVSHKFRWSHTSPGVGDQLGKLVRLDRCEPHQNRRVAVIVRF